MKSPNKGHPLLAPSPSEKRRERWRRHLFPGAILAFLFLGLVVRIVISWQPRQYHLGRGPLIDDAFYSLQIARNLARGLGLTFDGLNPTNGFQPLYVFLVTPFYWFFPRDLWMPVYLALTLSALANVTAGYFLYRIACRQWGRSASLFALGVFSLSPYVINHGLNGLETSLAALLWMITLDFYLGKMRTAEVSWRRAVIQGILFALLVFGRIDGGLLAAAVALDYLVWTREGTPPFLQRLKLMTLSTMSAAILYLPWVLWNLHSCGRMTPVSGEAVRFISLALARQFAAENVGETTSEGIPFLFYLFLLSFSSTLAVLGRNSIFFPAGLVGDLLHRIGGATAGGFAIAQVGCFVLLVGSIIWFRRVEKRMNVLLLAAGLTLLAYNLYVFGFWYFARYFYPVNLCLLLMGAALFQSAAQVIPPSGRKAAFLFLVIFYMFNYISYGINAFFKPSEWNFAHCYKLSEVMKEMVPPRSRVGVFQAGAAGYFSERVVINLDGAVNAGALAALKGREFLSYLHRQRIEYVVDYSDQFERLLWPALKDGEARHFVLLTPETDEIRVYQILGPQGQ